MAETTGYLVHVRGSNYSINVNFGVDLSSKTLEIYDCDNDEIATGWSLPITTTLGISSTTATRTWNDSEAISAVEGPAFTFYIRTTDKSYSTGKFKVWHQ